MKTIDLHGIRYNDAKRQLELFINENWGKRLKIITGNSEEMKEVVCELLNYYHLEFTRDFLFGFIMVKEH